MTSEDHVYLTDFGLTKKADSASGFTAAGQMLGTIDYVAPEQIEGNEAGARAATSTGSPASPTRCWSAPPRLRASGGMAKMWAHLNAEPPSVREQRLDVPEAAGRGDQAGPRQAPGRPPHGGRVRGRGAAGRRRDAVGRDDGVRTVGRGGAPTRRPSARRTSSMIRPSATQAEP